MSGPRVRFVVIIGAIKGANKGAGTIGGVNKEKIGEAGVIIVDIMGVITIAE